MLGDSNQPAADVKDSFYDDQEETMPAVKPIQSIRIITSKPPVYRRESDSSRSPSPSSLDSDHDVTDVSSIGGEHHHHHHHHQQRPRENDKRERQQQANHNEHTFKFQSMKSVLFGSSAPSSRPPSPAHLTSPANSKKQVRIVAEDEDKFNDDRLPDRNHRKTQPYIHGHNREAQRVRLTSSAINRQKQQQRIERENLKILERLQNARASRGLKREELLSHYDRQIGYVTYPTPSITATPTRQRTMNRPSSALPTPPVDTVSEKKSTQFNRPSSASHSINSNSVRSRPVSAPTSLHGSSRSLSGRRPIWNDRWQTNQE